MAESSQIKFVRVKGTLYLKATDVAIMLTEFGATEDTDVRLRIGKIARAIYNKQ